MKQETAKHLADGVGALAASSGILTSWLGYLNHYAAGIGVICTVFFGCIYATFHYLSFKKLCQADDNKEQIQRLEAMQKENIKSIVDELHEIKNKIK